MGLRRVGDQPVDRVFVEPVLGAHSPDVEPDEPVVDGPHFSFDGVETSGSGYQSQSVSF